MSVCPFLQLEEALKTAPDTFEENFFGKTCDCFFEAYLMDEYCNKITVCPFPKCLSALLRQCAAQKETLHKKKNRCIKFHRQIQFGAVDIAVHNACLCTFENERDTGCEVYQKVMDVNYFGALRLTKAVLPFMRKVGRGRIICAAWPAQ